MLARLAISQSLPQLATLLVAVATCSGCAATAGDPCAQLSCGPGQHCVVGSDGLGICSLPCHSSQTCTPVAAICDPDLASCRPCAVGEDSLCQARSVDTPRCVGGHCVACVAPRGAATESADCQRPATGSATPICERNVCRGCQLHSECSSGVCAKDAGGASFGVPQGSCVPASQLLVVDQGLCSGDGPVYCTPRQAIDNLSPSRRYILLRKSAQPSDFANLTLGGRPEQLGSPIYIIGPLADHPPQQCPELPRAVLGGVAGSPALAVSGGSVVIEGAFVSSSSIGVACSGAKTHLTVVRSLFSGNSTALLATSGCDLTVDQTWIGSGPAQTALQGLPGNARGLEVNGAHFQVTNSVFVDDGDYRQDAIGGIHVITPSASTTPSTVINATFYQQHGILKSDRYLTSLVCDVPATDRIVFLNTLFFGDQALLTTPAEHYLDPSCGARTYNLGSDDPTLTDNQSLVVPSTARLFIDSVGRNLRLLAGGDPSRLALAAGGAAAVSVGGVRLVAPSVDLAGQPRGQAGKPVAIGALEPAAAPDQ